MLLASDEMGRTQGGNNMTIPATQGTDHHFIGEIVVFVNQDVQLVGGLGNQADQRLKGGNAILGFDIDSSIQRIAIAGDSFLDPDIEMMEQGTSDRPISVGQTSSLRA